MFHINAFSTVNYNILYSRSLLYSILQGAAK